MDLILILNQIQTQALHSIALFQLLRNRNLLVFFKGHTSLRNTNYKLRYNMHLTDVLTK